MSIINVDFSNATQASPKPALNEVNKSVDQSTYEQLSYDQWKSHKRLELIMRDCLDNADEYAMRIALACAEDCFEEVQIISPKPLPKKELSKDCHLIKKRLYQTHLVPPAKLKNSA